MAVETTTYSWAPSPRPCFSPITPQSQRSSISSTVWSTQPAVAKPRAGCRACAGRAWLIFKRSTSAPLFRGGRRARTFTGHHVWMGSSSRTTPPPCIPITSSSRCPLCLAPQLTVRSSPCFIPLLCLSSSHYVLTHRTEGSIFAPKSLSSSNDFISYLKDQFPNITSSQQEKLLDHYPKDIRPSVKDHSDWYPSAALAYGEAVFVCPTDNFLDALSLAFSSNSSSSSSSSPPPLYSYRYDVEDDDVVASGKGVPHTSESAAIFGPDMLPSHGPASYYTSNADVVPLVMNYFISFARTLDPNVHKLEDGPLWGTWDEGRNRMLFQTQNADMENVGDQEQGRCSFWNSIQATTKQ